MNKINLLKRLLPKILIASLCLTGVIFLNPISTYAAAYQVGVQTSLSGSYSTSSTSSAVHSYTDKWVSNNATLNSLLKWSGAPSNTSGKVASGGHYTSHSHTGSCGKWSQGGLSGYTCGGYPKNSGYVTDYTTYYYTTHNSTATFTPTVDMNGATITYQVLNGSTVVYSQNYTVELNLQPSISTGLKSSYSNINYNNSTDLSVIGYMISTYTWQVKKKGSSNWQNIESSDPQFSGVGTEKLTFTPQNLDYNEAEIKVIGANSYIATTAESSTKLFLNVDTFTPKISSNLTKIEKRQTKST